jgi:PAS domain S-box-containing protein
MPNTAQPLRWSFQTKVLVPVLAFLVLIPGITLWIVNEHINEQMRLEARHALATADAVLRNSLEIRARHLVSRFRNTVNEPRFRAVAQLGDAETMSDFLRASLDEFGEEVEVTAFLTAPDRVVGGARRDAAMSVEEFARSAADVIASALEGSAGAGVVHSGNRILNVVAVPVMDAERASVLGSLSIGVRLGVNALQELQSLTNTEVLLLADNQIAASTVLRLEPALLLGLKPGEPQPVIVEGEHFLAQSGTYESGGVQRGVGYVLLSSYEGRLQALRRTQATLIGISLAGIVLSTVAVWWLIRRITQPLRKLRASAEAVSRGDFSQRVEQFSNDECGQLATAFNHMTASVQTSHATLERAVATLRSTQGQLLEREMRLRESEEELRLIIASARDHAIFTVDPKGRVVRWNPGAERLFGYKAGEAAGLSYASFFNTEDRSAMRPDRLLAATAAEGRQSFEGWRVRRDGSCFWADITVCSLHDPAGKGTTGFVEITRDITVRQQAVEALRQARDTAEAVSRAKSEFLANMSHEIRTPMNAVLGLTSLLLDQKLPPAQQEIATTIRSGAEALLSVIDDLLDLTALEAGNLELHPQDFDLRTCVERVAAQFTASCAQKSIAVELRFATDLPPIVTADSARIGQIFTRLVGNAVKFTERGRIEVVVAPAPDISAEHVRCVVADTGIGIPHGRQGDLFKPFFQVDSSAARRYGGTGLGLALAKRLVELLGGTISCDSSPGQGSRFAFTLRAPAASFDREPPKLPPPPPEVATKPQTGSASAAFAQRCPMRVLVVEDNLVNTKVLTLILGKLGYKPETAANGIEALQRLEQQKFDLVFMDLQMPEMDGIEATRQLRKRVPVTSPPYILAFTANASQEDRGACTASGMHDFESKPANIEKISRALERAYAWLNTHGSPASGN